MKTRFLFLLLLLPAALLATDISDVRKEGGFIVVFDSEGNRISTMSDMGSKEIAAVTSGFFVTKNDYSIETYNAQCERLGSMPAYNKTVTGASGSTFSVEENGFTNRYDSQCNRVSDSPSSDSQEIARVSEEGGFLVVYNAAGSRLATVAAMGKQVKGTTSSFFVIQNDAFIETYDAQGNRLGVMPASGKTVRGAVGSTFTVSEHGWIVTYDSKCNRLSTQPER